MRNKKFSNYLNLFLLVYLILLTVMVVINSHRIVDTILQTEDNSLPQNYTNNNIINEDAIGNCPMCGSSNVGIHNIDSDYYIECDECHLHIGYDPNYIRLIEIWNCND